MRLCSEMTPPAWWVGSASSLLCPAAGPWSARATVLDVAILPPLSLLHAAARVDVQKGLWRDVS